MWFTGDSGSLSSNLQVAGVGVHEHQHQQLTIGAKFMPHGSDRHVREAAN
jgi:hypothetical protein